MLEDLGICLIGVLCLFAVMFGVIWFIDVAKNKKAAIATVFILSVVGLICGMTCYAITGETWACVAGSFCFFPLKYAGEQANELNKM